jgi:hypothetical protein
MIKSKKKNYYFNLAIFEYNGDKIIKIDKANFKEFNIIIDEVFKKLR